MGTYSVPDENLADPRLEAPSIFKHLPVWGVEVKTSSIDIRATEWNLNYRGVVIKSGACVPAHHLHDSLKSL